MWVLRKWFVLKTRVSLNSVRSVLGEKKTAGSRAFCILLTQDTALEAESQKMAWWRSKMEKIIRLWKSLNVGGRAGDKDGVARMGS